MTGRCVVVLEKKNADVVEIKGGAASSSERAKVLLRSSVMLMS